MPVSWLQIANLDFLGRAPQSQKSGSLNSLASIHSLSKQIGSSMSIRGSPEHSSSESSAIALFQLYSSSIGAFLTALTF